jgi:predicted TIM-barrel enzyme
MPRFERQQLMERFRDMRARRVPIIGGGAGTGLSAKCEEAGGIDLIVITTQDVTAWPGAARWPA